MSQQLFGRWDEEYAPEDDGMDYSDTYGTPTPAQSKARGGNGGRDEKESPEKNGRAEEKEEEDEPLAIEESKPRSRKRPRIRSPGEEGVDESWSPAKTRETPFGEKSSDEGRSGGSKEEGAKKQDQQLHPQENKAPPVAAEAPPPYPALPSAEECERLIEEVVSEAAETLRTKLRELVQKTRGRPKQDGEGQLQMSQETQDYWQHYTDPTEVLRQTELEQILGGQALTMWSAQEEQAATAPSLLAFPEIQYGDMASLYAKAALKHASAGPALLQPRPQNTAPMWGQTSSVAEDPRMRTSKGKEKQGATTEAPMDVDNPQMRRGPPSAITTTAALMRAQENIPVEENVVSRELGQRMAEERRREALRKKWDDARLASPIADKEASGQPEHRRAVDEEELAQAMALRASRTAAIEKLGLAPLLVDGNPAIHANSPRDRVRNIPEAKLSQWCTEAPGTYVLLDVYGEGDFEDTDPQRIYDNLQAALFKITGLRNVKLEQPPRTPRTVSKEHATTVWFATGLYPAAVTLLAAVHAWPTADITFFAYKEIEFIPRYLFAIKGFTQKDQDEVRLAVWEVFRESPVYPSILNLVKKNPDYVGADHYEVTDNILSTIEVAVRPVNDEKHARLITHVYMTTPTRSAAMWESWRDGLRYPGKERSLSEEHPHLEISQRITHCKACHGADHLTTQCPYGHLEGWAKITEGAPTRRPDQWRSRTPRAGPSHHANEQGGAPPDDAAGNTGWSYVEGRGGGGRPRGARGGGPARGAQPRSRRG
ncbi:hypothetical protein OH77DRAFT_1435048 [Trametes cingulata]|nr:hypothetical protein OH77DRAFT_1435048 [Trametes cingulata]